MEEMKNQLFIMAEKTSIDLQNKLKQCEQILRDLRDLSHSKMELDIRQYKQVFGELEKITSFSKPGDDDRYKNFMKLVRKACMQNAQHDFSDFDYDSQTEEEVTSCIICNVRQDSIREKA
jgi:hypothetical protein